MTDEIWVVEGVGEDNPRKYAPRSNETVGEFKRHFANKLNVSANEVDVSTSTRKLTNERSKISELVADGETVHIIPRAKAGM